MGGMVKKVTAQKEGGMKKEISICEICKSRAENDEQKRKENWLEITWGICVVRKAKIPQKGCMRFLYADCRMAIQRLSFLLYKMFG
jgi:hypothetical protein